jgi:hypothetical protein
MGRNVKIAILIAVCAVIGVVINKAMNMPVVQTEYGVFLGIDRTEIEKLTPYETVVIEPSAFNSSDIADLHEEGKTVFGYLNIGSVEEYRSYFERFQDLSLGVYQNWPDERWVDVSDDSWQSFIINELGKQYADMGLDGFFLDNCDVYYQFPRDDIFDGLCSILNGLTKYDKKLIINGGDTFVSKCIDEGSAAELFDGVNQESVFTSIDFETNTYGKQTEKEKTYFQNYLKEVKASGISVYLLEYGADSSLLRQIDAYCHENGYLWYNADDKDLT